MHVYWVHVDGSMLIGARGGKLLVRWCNLGENPNGLSSRAVEH